MEDATSKTRRRGRWLKILLVGSLALNLGFVGLMAGAFMRADGGGAKRAPALSAFGAPYMMALPREERRRVVRALRGSADGDLPDRAMRRQMYSDVLTALRAMPYDPDLLKAAVEQQSTATIAVRNKAQAEWMQIVAEMTDEERSDYAYAVEEVLRRGPKRK